MRLPTLLSTLLAAAAAATASASRVAPVFIQPLTSPETAPALLAELAVPDQPASTTSDTTSASSPAEVLSYEAPDLPDSASLVRIGVYDAAAKRWASSTSVVSVENFAKGYAPHFVLSIDGSGEGEYLGVLCRGVAIDAGQTRDFGPQAVVVRVGEGAQPALGKPVVLSPEGRNVEEVAEKSLLQKFVFTLLLLVLVRDANVVCLQVLVGASYRCVPYGFRRRRRWEIIDLVSMFGYVIFLLGRSRQVKLFMFAW
jgi:hypothetical protein